MPRGVSPGQANVEQEDMGCSDLEDDLMEDVDDVMNDIYGTTIVNLMVGNQMILVVLVRLMTLTSTLVMITCK